MLSHVTSCWHLLLFYANLRYFVYLSSLEQCMRAYVWACGSDWACINLSLWVQGGTVNWSFFRLPAWTWIVHLELRRQHSIWKMKLYHSQTVFWQRLFHAMSFTLFHVILRYLFTIPCAILRYSALFHVMCSRYSCLQCVVSAPDS